MGAIFEAEHTATERRVALKLLFPHIMGVGNVLEKFELEARVSARVGCPHIVEVLDAGYDSGTQSPFLVMELLEGQTLARRVDEQGPLAVDEALRVLQQVAVGLDAAHGYREPGGLAKPIVHRDLKPENLFLANGRDGSVSVKILDYGIAKVLGGSASISQDVRGTPLFMAVEQVTASELSPQTDIWAFGLIAYHALTGSHYWRSARRSDASVQALFAEILSLPLEAPSARAREHAPSIELPPGFDAWLLRCIDREPARRFASAGDAYEVLRRRFEAASASGAQPAPQVRRTDVPVQDAAVRPGVAGSSLPAMATTQHRPATQQKAAAKVSRWAFFGAMGSIALGLVVWLGAALGGPEPQRAAPPAGWAGASPPPAPVSEPRTEPSIAPVRAARGAGVSERPVPEPAAIVRVVPIDEPGPAVAPMVGSAAPVSPAAETSLDEATHEQPARNETMQVDPAHGERAPEKKRTARVKASTRPAGAPKAAVPGAGPGASTKPPPTASEAYRVR
jgi:serine/threonine-protein kinase